MQQAPSPIKPGKAAIFCPIDHDHSMVCSTAKIRFNCLPRKLVVGQLIEVCTALALMSIPVNSEAVLTSCTFLQYLQGFEMDIK